MMKLTIRHLSLFLCTGLMLLVSVADATANPVSRKRKDVSAVKPKLDATDKSELEKLIELTRRAQETAEQAQVEARRARQHSEALQQRLDKTEREFEQLRQMVAGNVVAAPKPTPQTSPATIQQSSEQKPDSRLANLEDQIEINTAQLKEHAQTKIESGSRMKMKLYGEILINTYFNSNDSADSDVPTIAFPDAITNGRKRNNLGATLRQSKIGLALSGPRIGNAKLSGDVELDFWGGPISRYDGDVLGSLRVRTASARLDWDRTTLEFGQLEPMISPLNPTSLAASWILPMASTGNLWQWRPQITLEHRARLSDSSSLIVQAGLLPNFNDVIGTPFGVAGGVSNEGDPGYEGRIAFRRALEDDRRFEIGFGGYGERKTFPFKRRVNSYALTGDWQIPLSSRLMFSGEAYYGQSINLGERAGISIERLYAFRGNILSATTEVRGIRTGGAWAQLSLQATKKLEFNLAAGKDDPNNNDIRFGAIGNFTRFKNQAASANFIYFLTPNFEMSLEYRRTLTDYAPGRRTNNHVNLTFGYLF
ncbi:MAG: hypothetical protein SF097_27855 [Acidobacteriota bacterium]|nr:hypothetical protein [Acidobacteriota bacterium]